MSGVAVHQPDEVKHEHLPVRGAQRPLLVPHIALLTRALHLHYRQRVNYPLDYKENHHEVSEQQERVDGLSPRLLNVLGDNQQYGKDVVEGDANPKYNRLRLQKLLEISVPAEQEEKNQTVVHQENHRDKQHDVSLSIEHLLVELELQLETHLALRALGQDLQP